jgi:hypothetical protein
VKTKRRKAQNRNTVPSAAPTTLAETLSARADCQWSTLRVTHRQDIEITNDARLTSA